jgi:hypothetical protein
LVLGSGCTSAESEGFNPPAYLDYVNSLRGGNDLALGALTVSAEASDRPVGLGTIADSRDAVRLLFLTSGDYPSWLGQGIAAELARVESGDFVPTVLDQADLLYLCQELDLRCPDSFKSAVEAELRSVEGVVGEPVSDDERFSRLVDTAVWTDLSYQLVCDAERFREWMAAAPLTTMAIAVQDMSCYADSAIPILNRETEDKVVDSLRQGDLNAAVSWAMLRFLLDSRTDEYRDRVHQAWDSAMESLQADRWPVDLEQEKPLHLEYLKTNLEQWLY